MKYLELLNERMILYHKLYIIIIIIPANLHSKSDKLKLHTHFEEEANILLLM